MKNNLWIVVFIICIVLIVAIYVGRFIFYRTTPGKVFEAFQLFTGSNDNNPTYPKSENVYNQWIICLARLKLLGNTYESKNILERWYMCIENNDKNATSKMALEIFEKKIKPSIESATDLANDVCNIKINQLESQNSVPVFYTKNQNTIIQYNQFRRSIDTNRLKLLQQLAQTALCSNFNDEIVSTIIKYSALATGGQQWAIPFDVYQIFVNQYNATLEGFASPINSRMLQLEKQYCSLYDSDKIFGSIGNFFDTTLVGRTTIVNPPYTESLLEKAAEYCISQLQSSNTQPTRMFFVVPSWKDAHFYHLLLQTNYMEQYTQFENDTCYFEDTTNGISKIKARFAVSLFVLSVNMEKCDISPIVNAFQKV